MNELMRKILERMKGNRDSTKWDSPKEQASNLADFAEVLLENPNALTLDLSEQLAALTESMAGVSKNLYWAVQKLEALTKEVKALERQEKALEQQTVL